jgi:hypothetical protein
MRSRARVFAILAASAAATGIGWTLAGKTRAQASDYDLSITIADVMDAIVVPESEVVWNSITYESTADGGVEAVGPQTEEGGLSDAWYDPQTVGQGFFITVLPELESIFLAWFTFDTERPDQDVAAMLVEPGHRWLTAQGPFLGDTAVLDVYLTEGGVFDAGTPKPVTGPPIGTITIVWQDCEHATLTYEIDPPGVMGAIPITRVAPDNVALCEAYY